MKVLAIASIVLAAGFTSVATAQDSMTVHSGPWQVRKSTGNPSADRFWFITDRTLNAAEADEIRMLFRRSSGAREHVIMKAVLNAIDKGAQPSSNADMWSMNGNGMSDIEVYYALENGLDWQEKGVLHKWMFNATVGEMNAISKLVRMAGWANSQWTASGMGR